MTAPTATSATATSAAAGTVTAEPRPPRRSATLVFVRDGAEGPEVLLLRRDDRGDPSGGAWVFPGGLVDRHDAASRPFCAGTDDAAVSARLGLPEGGLDYVVAAVRESFEECGLLLALEADGQLASAARAESLQSWRGALNDGSRTLVELCMSQGLRLAADRLPYISHWITPVGYAKRFDVRFFVAEAPAGQAVHADGSEVLEHRWLRPAHALAIDAGMKLMNPTRKTLALMAPHASVAAILAWARALGEIPCIQPHAGVDANGPRPVNPDEPAWAEIRRLDPLGTNPPRCDIQADVPVRLSPRVIRVTAPNGSVMTGPGTNAYLVGPGIGDDPASGWAVIDPGPNDPGHVDALIAAAPGPIRWVLATHTHLDHSPATVALRAATGATVLGRRPHHMAGQDTSFQPDRELVDGERLSIGTGTTLRVIHTPGHASNHLCYLLEEERTLFTGDHVMQGSTVVIAPPDGDMAAYVGSLRELLHDEAPMLEWLAPGHGFLMAQPAQAMQALVDHRMRREAKVLDALRTQGGGDLDDLLVPVYADVAPHLHRPAKRSLLAHLLKLEKDGVAVEVDGRWSLKVPAGA